MSEISLEKQLEGTQHILGHVLKVIGQPVVVPKKDMDVTLGDKYRIEMSETEDAFVFSLSELDGQ